MTNNPTNKAIVEPVLTPEDNDIDVRTLILYGKLMLESNYDISDIRSNLVKMMSFMKINFFSIYVTPTNLMLINNKTNDVKMLSIQSYSYNFEKMGHIKTEVDLFLKKKLTTEELHTELRKIEKHDYAFPKYIQVLVAGIICGSMYVLINKLTHIALFSFGIGSFSYAVYLLSERYLNIKIFSVFLYSTVVSTLAVLLVKFGLTQGAFALVLSCMMPLLPGATFVNSIKNSINGDYLSGISQASDAINTALMLGLPVTFILANFL